MIGGGTAVGPLDLAVIEHREVFELEQHPGREPREFLVERGLERAGAGRGDEIGEHRDRASIKDQAQPFEPPALRRAVQRLAEQPGGGWIAIERRALAALPARHFEREEMVDPGRQALVVGVALDPQLARFGQPRVLAAQLLALFGADRLVEIGGGIERGLEQRALLALDQRGAAAFPLRLAEQRGGELAVERQLRDVREQRGAAIVVGPGEERGPERALVAPGDQRCAGEGVGVQPDAQVRHRPAAIAPGALDRDQPDQLAAALEAQDLDLARRIEAAQRGEQVPAFEERIGLGGRERQRIPPLARGGIGPALPARADQHRIPRDDRARGLGPLARQHPPFDEKLSAQSGCPMASRPAWRALG